MNPLPYARAQNSFGGDSAGWLARKLLACRAEKSCGRQASERTPSRPPSRRGARTHSVAREQRDLFEIEQPRAVSGRVGAASFAAGTGVDNLSNAPGAPPPHGVAPPRPFKRHSSRVAQWTTNPGRPAHGGAHLQLVEQFVPCRAGLHTATPGAARLARTMRGIPQYEFRSSGRVSAATEHANYAFRASTAICRSCASRLLLTYMTPNMRRGDAGSRRLQHRRRLAPLLQSLGLWCALTGA